MQPRWPLEETLLLFLLLDREVAIVDKASSNLAKLDKEFNNIVDWDEVSDHHLNKKSIGQIKAKICNMLKYVGVYDRNKKELV